MNQLSKEALEAIENEDPLWSDTTHSALRRGIKVALTTPSIYEAAGLISKFNVSDLIKENEYLKAEFEANKDKVYTQGEMLKVASDAWNACRDRADWESGASWYAHKNIAIPQSKLEYMDSLTKIQSLK